MATVSNNKPKQSSVNGLSADQINELRQRAARKMGIPVEQVAGPFSSSDTPIQKSGLYLRVSPKSGSLMWAHFDVSYRYWGLFSNKSPNGGIDRALARRTRRSRKSTMWFGVSDAVHKGIVKSTAY